MKSERKVCNPSSVICCLSSVFRRPSLARRSCGGSIVNHPSSIVFFMSLLLFLCTCPAFGTINFNDGLIHDIDYAIYDNVRVDYQTPNMYTTINVLTGASMSSQYRLRGYKNSRINVSGGLIGSFYSYDSSQVNVSGGWINELVSLGSSQLNISGGSVDSLGSNYSSQVKMSGGSIHYLQCGGSSKVDISAGSIDTLCTVESGQANIYGGSIEYIQSMHSSQANIYGGTIDGALCSMDSSQANIYDGSIEYIQSIHSSQVNIYGGTIGDGHLALWDQSLVQIFGYDFAVDGQPFGYGELTSIFGGYVSDEPLRHLTGTLLSGDLIDNDFYIGHDGRIVLIPEPASVILLGLGGLALRKRKH